jgi:hypothetical protein
MDDDLGPMSKCDPMLSSPDNHLHTLSSGLSSSAALQLVSSSSSMSSGGSSSSRCSSVDNLESLESSHGGAGLNNLDGGAAYVATRGRPPAAAASSGRRRGPAMKRLHERNGGAERTESVRLPRAEVFMGAPPRQRIPVVTRTSIITSTAAAAQSQPPPPPPAFSMIFPLPEEISQLSDEFMPSSSAATAAATSPTFRTLNHHHQHQLRNDGANHNQTEASPSSLSSPKQVSLEILPGACLSHHDLGGFFVTAAATSASEMSNTETLSERCLSLDDLRTSSSASSNGIGFQPGATMTAGSGGSCNAVVRASSAAATYSLHPLGGGQSSYVHHQLGACKKVILEERPITPHGTGHHNTDSKVYLRL